ncbi:phosphotransferase family protein [Bradyrhizobium sp. YR681]|uniref:phosphotransferase family protein n=1 Tax=Bradyrhizobium sp. YR681 TaxID=1144344 RepID=UPI0002711BB9|nr:phosphotransferase [Bradyrhizobium sp. YR681]EJN13535.1 phosphotransferase family protein [Bradyrhizobium sp. YR681]
MNSASNAPDVRQLAFVQKAWATIDGAPDAAIEALDCLSGGVSSDVWRCTLRSGRCIVAKRALPRLRVAMEWLADPRRGLMEARWLGLMAEHLPGFAPRAIGYVADDRVLFMEYLDEALFANWREELLTGRCDVQAGSRLGAGVASTHNVFAGRTDLRNYFHARDILTGTRIDPYFDAVAAVHPALRKEIAELADSLLRADAVVIHGDISPKNVLVGTGGPILLDAECACVGEAAFDPAFFLAQLCLKSIIRPDCADSFHDLAVGFIESYLAGVNFASSSSIDRRVVKYLLLFMLGRIDGKVPVPYLQAAKDKEFGRRFALTMFQSPPACTVELLEQWHSYVRHAERREVALERPCI